MKQLKFMLAAATVIGLATAAQAALTSENFNGMPKGTPITNETEGFEYTGTENDSEIVEVTTGNNALRVNTGTDPLLRAVDFSQAARPVELTENGLNSLDINTKVQFTVTPVGDEVDAKAGDKLMIYLKESTNYVEGVLKYYTNLVVKAAGPVDENDTEAIAAYDYVVKTGIEPNKWYNLKVASSKFIVDEEAADDEKTYYPCFQIYIGEEGDDLELLARTAAAFDSFDGIDDAREYFPSLQLVGKLDGVGIAAPNVTYVGFAGEGLVDDIVVTKSLAATPVDFILYLGTGVSAVSYTVDDGEAATLTAASNKLYGISLEIKTISYAPGYSAGSVGVGTYDAADLEVNATKATIDTEGDDATTGAAVGFAGTEFAATTGEPLVKLINWTGANRVSADVVKAMSFDSNGNPPGVSTADAIVPEEAYLLNCALSFEAIEQAKEDFVLTADDLAKLMADPTNPGALSVDNKYNGTLTIQGAVELGGEDKWHAKTADDMFFRAKLTK